VGLSSFFASTLVVKQKNLTACKNGHDVQIIPELFDKTQEKHSTNNFMLIANYCC